MLNNHVDLIGDIHGHADELHALLKQLGYKEIDGVYSHPERSVVFLGDFIDRGPHQNEVLRIAKSMCDAGTSRAIMGNHEFNAIGWVTQNKDGQFLRSHDAVHHHQHEAFLAQIGEDSDAHRNAIEWFWTLPVLINEPFYRAVHACWHRDSIFTLKNGCLNEEYCFTREGFQLSNIRKTKVHEAMEVVLKGPELELPEGVWFKDKSGHIRHEARIKWWDQKATTFRSAALGMDGCEDELPTDEIGDKFFYVEPIPVFFGHYWLKGDPVIEADNAVCLDYSVAKDGKLTAYSLGTEKLSNEQIKYVRASS